MLKRILVFLISLAILLAIVNLAKAAPIVPRPVCQIDGNIISVEKFSPQTASDNQALDYDEVQINIANSFILSGAEYGDCSYLSNKITAKYYEKLSLQTDEHIIAKVESLADEVNSDLLISELMTAPPNNLNEDLILVNSSDLNLSHPEVWAGQKFKVFADKFVFQIDKEMIDQDATLSLKEIILPPNSYMAPQAGLQLASRVYEYDFKTTNSQDLGKVFWFSIKYESNDYFRKNIYYFDEVTQKWTGLSGIIKDGSKKIVVNSDRPKAKVAILEDIDIMTEGSASWYKYKGCNCAASPDYPKGTKLKVTNIDNNKSVVVKVNDWGPDRSVHPDRVIDLDVVAFKKIAKKSAGLCKVRVELAEEKIASALTNK